MNNKKEKCLSSTGYILSAVSSTFEGLGGGGSTASSILTLDLPLSTRVAIAAVVGGFTGIVDAISNFCFQGAVVRENFSRKSSDDSENDLDYVEISDEISKKKKFNYFALKYGYSSFALVIAFFQLYLLCSATKAWVNDLVSEEDVPLSTLSHMENALLLTIFLIFDAPFILTNEIPQSCKEITKRFNISPDNLPDQFLLNKIKTIAMPFAKSSFIRKFIRVAGSLSDTLEHVLPLIIIVPPSWVLSFINQPIMYTAGIGTATALMFTLISGTIYAQTYWFEGKYSEENLKNIAWEEILYFEEEIPWINSKFARLFHLLLYLGGPLHGIDASLTMALTLREFKAPPISYYIAGMLAFLIGWMNNHFSEVKESQESLRKNTKLTLANQMSGSHSIRLFSSKHVNYGTQDKQLAINHEETHSLLYPV